MSSQLIQNKVKEYESFIEDVLKKDLKDIEVKLSKSVGKHGEWEELQTTIALLRRFKDRELNLLVPLDCGVSVNAETDDYNRLLVNIGAGCFLELDYDEAHKYADIRLRIVKKEIDHYRDLAAKVKAKIKITLLAIDQLSNGSIK
nr:protein UXT-like [Onthophagus taurus]